MKKRANIHFNEKRLITVAKLILV